MVFNKVFKNKFFGAFLAILFIFAAVFTAVFCFSKTNLNTNAVSNVGSNITETEETYNTSTIESENTNNDEEEFNDLIEKSEGYIAEENNLSFESLYSLEAYKTLSSVTPPPEYLSYNVPNKLKNFSSNNCANFTPNVGDQHFVGICWAFAAMTTFETTLYKKGLATDGTLNFSELHCAYFTEVVQLGDDSLYGSGFTMACHYIASGYGPVAEQSGESYYEDNPIWSNGKKAATLYGSNFYSSAVKDNRTMFESVSFPSIASCTTDGQKTALRNSIKNHILTYGAVKAGVKLDGTTKADITKDPAFFSEKDGNFFYCYGGTLKSPTHAVAIVGWDDDVEDAKGHTGAYIIQNSWGADWAGDGYAYVMYDDKFIETSCDGFARVGYSLPENESVKYNSLEEYPLTSKDVAAYYDYNDKGELKLYVPTKTLWQDRVYAKFFDTKSVSNYQYVSRISIGLYSGESSSFYVYLAEIDDNLQSLTEKQIKNKLPNYYSNAIKIENKKPTKVGDIYLFEPGMSQGYYTIELTKLELLKSDHFAIFICPTNDTKILRTPYFDTTITNKACDYMYECRDSSWSKNGSHIFQMIVQTEKKDYAVDDFKTTYDGNTKQIVANCSAAYTAQFSLNGTSSWSATAGYKNAGTYTMYCRFKKGSDYSDVFSATLKINKRNLTVTPKANQSKVYDGTMPSKIYCTSSGYVSGQTPDFNGKPAISSYNVGTYDITQGNLALKDKSTFLANNYELVFTTGVKYKIKEAKITGAVFNNASYTYDGISHYLTATCSISGVNISYSEEGVEDDWRSLGFYSDRNAGSYVFYAKFSKQNYEDLTLSATLTINKRILTVTPNPSQKTYDGTMPTNITYTSSGAVDDQTPKIEGSLKISSCDVGTYVIEKQDNFKLGNNGAFLARNYELSFTTNVTYKITERTLTITPKTGQFKLYGHGDPTLEHNPPVGAVTGETPKFDGALSRKPGEELGSYEILLGNRICVNNGKFKAKNYKLVLSSTKVYFTISENKITGYNLTTGSFVFDYTNHTLIASCTTADVTILYSSNGENWQSSYIYYKNVGEYTIHAKFSKTGYEDQTLQSTLIITPLIITITPKENQSKDYGDPNENLTFVSSGTGNTNVRLVTRGSLTREPGNSVGSYRIMRGNLELIDDFTDGNEFIANNYWLEFSSTPVYFTINPARILDCNVNNVVADYNGGLHYVYPTCALADADIVYSADRISWFTRSIGYKDVGTYTIYVQFSSDNFITEERSATITINAISLTVTPVSGQNKVYGENDPDDFAKTWSGNLAYETPDFDGKLSRVEGKDVGLYRITRGTLVLKDNDENNFKAKNYVLKFSTEVVNFEITKADLTDCYVNGFTINYNGLLHYVTAGNDVIETTKQYSVDNATWQDDNIGYKNVGTYTIYVKFSCEPNYNNDVLSAEISINPIEIEYVPELNQSKVYGEDDPEYFEYSVYGYLEGEIPAFEGSIAREPGENVGQYFYNQNTLALKDDFTNGNNFKASNYTLRFETLVFSDEGDMNTSFFTIVPAEIEDFTVSSVTHDYDGTLYYVTPSCSLAQSKFKYSTNGETWKNSNIGFKNAGTYTVYVKVSCLPNYNPRELPATIKINPINLTITPESGQCKVYGEEDPNNLGRNFKWVGNLSNETPNFNGNLVRDEGESVGEYVIRRGNLALTNGGTFIASNYVLNLSEIPVTFTIKTAGLQGCTVDTINESYSGQFYSITASCSTPGVSYQYSTDGTTWQNGNFAYKNVGTYNVYVKMSQSNYDDVVLSSTITISTIPLYVVPASLTKVYGESDPVLYCTWSNEVEGEVPGFTGNVVRETGEDVGEYLIDINNLALDNNIAQGFYKDNYYMVFDYSKCFTITEAEVEITINNIQSYYNEPISSFSYQIVNGSIVEGDNLNISYSCQVLEESKNGIVKTLKKNDNTPYVITATAFNPNYIITVNNGTYTILYRDYSVSFADFEGEIVEFEHIEHFSTLYLSLKEVPTYARDGYSFNFWKIVYSNEVFLPVADASRYVVTKNLVFTADLNLVDYYINYNGVSGEENITQTKFTIEDDDITLYSPTRKGYSFEGWYTDENFTDGTQIEVVCQGSTEDVNVYAKWSINYYEITLPVVETEKFSIDKSGSTSVAYGNDFYFKIILADAYNQSYNNIKVYVTLDGENQKTELISHSEHSYRISNVEQDCTIAFENIRINTYEISFYANNNKIATLIKDYGDGLTVLDFPEIPMEGKEHYNQKQPEWSAGEIASVTSNATYNAIYYPNVYEVTFVMPDGVSYTASCVYGSEANFDEIAKNYNLNVFESFVLDGSYSNISENKIIHVSLKTDYTLLWAIVVIAAAVVFVAILLIIKKRVNKINSKKSGTGIDITMFNRYANNSMNNNQNNNGQNNNGQNNNQNR